MWPGIVVTAICFRGGAHVSGNVTSYAGPHSMRGARSPPCVIVYEIVINRRQQQPQQPPVTAASGLLFVRTTNTTPELSASCCAYRASTLCVNIYSITPCLCRRVCVRACAGDTGPTHARQHARKSSATYETQRRRRRRRRRRKHTHREAIPPTQPDPADRITHLWQTIIVMFITVNAPEMLSTIYPSCCRFFVRCVRFCRVAVFVLSVRNRRRGALAWRNIRPKGSSRTLRTIAAIAVRACVRVSNLTAINPFVRGDT